MFSRAFKIMLKSFTRQFDQYSCVNSTPSKANFAAFKLSCSNATQYKISRSYVNGERALDFTIRLKLEGFRLQIFSSVPKSFPFRVCFEFLSDSRKFTSETFLFIKIPLNA